MAGSEAAFVGLVGLIPLVLAPFLNAHDPEVGTSAATGEIINLVSSGQLFLYCFALISTLWWLFIQNGKSAHIFFRAVIGATLLLISLTSMGVYIQNPSLNERIAAHLISFSAWSYAACVLMYFFLLMCGSADAPNPTKTFSNEVDRLVDRAREIRE